MKQFFYKGRFIFIPLAFAACISAVSFVVMQLWNHLLPDILHVTTINFWQAMGIFILCKILFGFGGKGGPGNAPWARRRMMEKCKNMSPEEREKFRTELENRMCGWGKRPFGRRDSNFDDRFKTNTERTSPQGDTPSV
ncbi:hypothetical protein LT679_18315 [Mucilaginibacter roseus]|uniref:DUF1682 domain-containing protein n=1 Tax=Mucilaginibacter roseus TaxID=1528868 RepID=A0ABS8U632_9SPHI|nr:hypothetical protein [Mucilaginibacter roseus]MCD8742571.1 hypothetical protein [Mucilaginibacter roseus]